MKTNNVLLGILGGAAAGAILGILFAPDKGSNTRKKIASNANDMKDNLKDNFGDFLDTVSNKYDNLIQSGSEIYKDGKGKLEAAAAEFSNQLDHSGKKL